MLTVDECDATLPQGVMARNIGTDPRLTKKSTQVGGLVESNKVIVVLRFLQDSQHGCFIPTTFWQDLSVKAMATET